jgi:hypothetical protein
MAIMDGQEQNKNGKPVIIEDRSFQCGEYKFIGHYVVSGQMDGYPRFTGLVTAGLIDPSTGNRMEVPFAFNIPGKTPGDAALLFEDCANQAVAEQKNKIVLPNARS